MDEDAVLLDESLSSEPQDVVSSTEADSPTVPGSTATSPASYSSISRYTGSPTPRQSPYVYTSGGQPAATASSPSYVSSDVRRVASSPKYQAELLVAKSKVTYLEAELLSLRRAAKRARTEEEGREFDKTKSSSLNAERVHMLEQERRGLLEDLLTQRDKLEQYEVELSRCQGQQALALSTHSKEVQVLRSQLDEELEHILKEQEEDAKFLESMKSQLIHCEDVERVNQQLKSENTHLREKNDNVELLRYQLQCLREKCTKLENFEQQLVDAQLTNKAGGAEGELETKVKELTGEGSGDGTSGDRVRSLEQTLGETATAAQDLKQQLLKEKEEAQNRDEKTQRLERRLLFVSKERDGCVNVLKSYQLDKSVDRLLKEQLKEMEQQLSRANERIRELEAEHFESKDEQEAQQPGDEASPGT
eukprot:Em0020g165a